MPQKKKPFELIYLYVPVGDTPCQSNNPPTEVDISCVAAQVLNIFRYFGGKHELLEIVNDRPIWNTVEEAELCSDAEDEDLGPYHVASNSY